MCHSREACNNHAQGHSVGSAYSWWTLVAEYEWQQLNPIPATLPIQNNFECRNRYTQFFLLCDIQWMSVFFLYVRSNIFSSVIVRFVNCETINTDFKVFCCWLKSFLVWNIRWQIFIVTLTKWCSLITFKTFITSISLKKREKRSKSGQSRLNVEIEKCSIRFRSKWNCIFQENFWKVWAARWGWRRRKHNL